MLATGPNHSIQLKTGRLVVPVWLSTGTGGNAHRPSVTATIYSDDQGKTWQAGEIAVPCTDEWINPNETVAIELADGRVMLNVRSESKAHRRLVTISKDGATGWSTPKFDDALLEPICMGGIVRYNHGGKSRILFSNPHNLDGGEGKAEPGKSRDRKNVSVKLSRDEGQTWPVNKTIEPGPSMYSDIAVTQSRHHPLLLRTRHQARLRRRRIDARPLQSRMAHHPMKIIALPSPIALAVSLSIIAAAGVNAEPSMPQRGLCAHRGAMSTHPENTLPALEEAVRLGAQMIEFDVQLTKDGALILMHDATVDRTTNGRGKSPTSHWRHSRRSMPAPGQTRGSPARASRRSKKRWPFFRGTSGSTAISRAAQPWANPSPGSSRRRTANIRPFSPPPPMPRKPPVPWSRAF